jgi:hypothetical protein
MTSQFPHDGTVPSITAAIAKCDQLYNTAKVDSEKEREVHAASTAAMVDAAEQKTKEAKTNRDAADQEVRAAHAALQAKQAALTQLDQLHTKCVADEIAITSQVAAAIQSFVPSTLSVESCLAKEVNTLQAALSSANSSKRKALDDMVDGLEKQLADFACRLKKARNERAEYDRVGLQPDQPEAPAPQPKPQTKPQTKPCGTADCTLPDHHTGLHTTENPTVRLRPKGGAVSKSIDGPHKQELKKFGAALKTVDESARLLRDAQASHTLLKESMKCACCAQPSTKLKHAEGCGHLEWRSARSDYGQAVIKLKAATPPHVTTLMEWASKSTLSSIFQEVLADMKAVSRDNLRDKSLESAVAFLTRKPMLEHVTVHGVQAAVVVARHLDRYKATLGIVDGEVFESDQPISPEEERLAKIGSVAIAIGMPGDKVAATSDATVYDDVTVWQIIENSQGRTVYYGCLGPNWKTSWFREGEVRILPGSAYF